VSDYSELRRLAEAATPGPWYVQKGRSNETCGYVTRDPIEQYQRSITGWGAVEHRFEDAAYIAAASPDVVLALIAERDAAIEHLSEAGQECDNLHATVRELYNALGVDYQAAALTAISDLAAANRRAEEAERGRDAERERANAAKVLEMQADAEADQLRERIADAEEVLDNAGIGFIDREAGESLLGLYPKLSLAGRVGLLREQRDAARAEADKHKLWWESSQDALRELMHDELPAARAEAKALREGLETIRDMGIGTVIEHQARAALRAASAEGQEVPNA
jgi:hypothetical protein